MSEDVKYRASEGIANKAHIRLRSPQVKISTVDFGSAGEFVTVMLDVKPFDLDHGTFNGACLELTRQEAAALYQKLGVKLGIANGG